MLSQHQTQARAKLEAQKRGIKFGWPDVYINSHTNKQYKPHNDLEHRFVYSDTPRYMLLKGGEGGGKSVAGIIKTLERLRRGMSGVMVSPDLEHFKKSLWPEFKRWCPWHQVIDSQRRRQNPGWEPTHTFNLVFKNQAGGYSELLCGGAKESDIGGWEGPNVSFVHFDEARRHRTANALKTFDGRARITGPNNEPPQLYFTTTPRKHWMYEYFGQILEDDPYLSFKQDSFCATLLTEENADNLEANFVEKRRQSLTEQEARVLLQAQWEDETDVDHFINPVWWDNCKEQLPPLTRNDAMVIAMDANKGGQTTQADCFAMIGVTRHPHRPADVAVRYCGIWQPQPGQLMDFHPIEQELRRLCREFSIIEVCYDPYQLHDMAMRLTREGVGHFKEFSQQKDRLIADKQLQNLIMSRRVSHDGNPLLTQHIKNADAKKQTNGLRIVKRSDNLKIDATVALSMATARILYYNI